MVGSEDWSCDANKAVTIELVQRGPQSPKRLSRFHPQFTYPIFGESQTIFGYQGLRINIRFASHDVRPNLEVSWEKQYETVGDTAAVDVKQVLEDWLPTSAFEPLRDFETHIQSDPSASSFKPLGELVNSYTINSKRCEVWRAQLNDPDVRQMLQRMQIFIPFLIEGGTYINLDDPEWSLQRWSVFFLYENQAEPPTSTTSPYVLLGYSTVYDYYLHSSPTLPKSTPPSSALENFSLSTPPPPTYPHRSRISQFLILPPFQHQGHGSHFYNSLVTSFLQAPSCVEITVEDPNEAFDDLRDYCDLVRLRTGEHSKEFTSLRINSAVAIPDKGRLPTSTFLPKASLTALRTATKIAPRQFERLVEMQLLSLIPIEILRTTIRRAQSTTLNENDKEKVRDKDKDKDKEYHVWRLLTKHRLYKFNRDKLAQVDLPERIKNLEEVTDGVEDDYLRLLGSLESAGAGSSSDREGGAANGSGIGGKRNLSAVDEMGDIGGTESPAKKAKP
ncbi:MAG: histone acetyltransferase 1 [Sclerophora amabilis]|nr:MAG: histone acetyltransferase 1 [Sclerophora amabilis]